MISRQIIHISNNSSLGIDCIIVVVGSHSASSTSLTFICSFYISIQSQATGAILGVTSELPDDCVSLRSLWMRAIERGQLVVQGCGFFLTSPTIALPVAYSHQHLQHEENCSIISIPNVWQWRSI